MLYFTPKWSLNTKNKRSKHLGKLTPNTPQKRCPSLAVGEIGIRNKHLRMESTVEEILHQSVYVYGLSHLVGGFKPSEKYESQLGWWHSHKIYIYIYAYGKTIQMFETTNQP